MTAYVPHPAAELFPLIEGEEFDVLVEDIRDNGLTEAVWLWDDPERGTVLLDGRNRVRACVVAGVPVRTRRYEGTDPIAFVMSENVKRRHLTTGQKAAIAAEAEPLYAAEAAKRKAQAPGQRRGEKQASVPADRQEETPKRKRESTERAAKTAGTSGRSVSRYRRVAQAQTSGNASASALKVDHA